MRATIAAAVLAMAVLGCSSDDGPLLPGPTVEADIARLLIDAKPGAVIELGAGTFFFTKTLSLSVDKVTIRGVNPTQTILSWKNQTEGSEGIKGNKTSDFVIENLAIEDTKGDGIKIKGPAKNVTFRNIRVEWTKGPDTNNGAYGIYPVSCTNVLIEKSKVIGASDAGVYVGQSDNIIVRDNDARQNVAGIEIENSTNADVINNTVRANSGGILIFDLPGLPKVGGKNIRVLKNQVIDNNTPNFAKAGAIVKLIPRGTGVMVMANDGVEITDNTITGNATVNIAVVSYLVAQRADYLKDKNYDPFPEGIYIHKNADVSTGGGAPDPDNVIGLALNAFVKPPYADIAWDGIPNPKKVDTKGNVPAADRLCIQNNGKATFMNLDGANLLKGAPKVNRDIKVHDCSHAALKAITLPQAK